MSPEDLEILVNTMPGGKRPPAFAIKLLEDTCESTGLDWKRRHVYLMERGGKWMVTLSIDGFRTVGANNPEYAGQEGPFYVMAANGEWTDVPPETPPYAAKVGIKARNGITTWAAAKFKDYAAGPMWTKFPSTMIAKCAEMLAWRKAFPGKLGGLYGVEEMEQAGAKRDKEKEKTEAPPATVEAFRSRIQAAADLNALTALGSEIKKADLHPADLNSLHEFYKARKLFLSATLPG